MRNKWWFIIFLITMFCIGSCNTVHIHAAVDNDDCYTGTMHTHTGSSSSGTGCYTGAYHSGSSTACGSISNTWLMESYMGSCGSCFQDGALLMENIWGTCSGCGQSCHVGMRTSCSCGASNSSLNFTHYQYTSGYYELACGKTAGKYYNADGSLSQNISNKVVTNLVAAAPVQSINAGGSVNATATATFLDGHTETVTCTVSGFSATTYSTAQTVTLSYGSYCDSAKNAYSKTTTVKVTVNGYFNLSVAKNVSAGGSVSSGGSKLAGSSITVTASPATGYQFNGWYNGSTKVSSSASYTFTMPAANYTLTANFSKIGYAANITSESTTKGTVSGGGTYYYGDSVTAVASQKAGYTFNGWYNGNTKVSSAASYTFTMPASAYSLVAKFTANTYTLNLNINGGTISGGNTYALTFGSGNYSDISWLNPKKTGYTFAGWYTASSGGTMVYNSSGVVVNDGTYWKSTLYAYAGNITLYAHWTANQYTVSFNANGGTCGTSNMSVTFDAAYGTLPEPNRTGYIFDGWYYGTDKITNSMAVTIAGDHTLLASWTPRTDITYIVKHHVERDGEYRLYETNEYKGTADATVHINGLQTVYKEFDYKEGRVNGSVSTTATIYPDGSLVIDLYYDRKNPLVTFYYLYTDGFTVSMKPSVVISEKNAAGGYEITAGLPDEDVYSREGNKLCVYRFVGWLNEAGEMVSSFADIREDMVLYAQYELVPYLNPDSDTADADTSVQGLRKAEAATKYADNTFRYLEYGNTLLEMDLAALGAFDYVTAYYPWLDETRTITYEDGVFDDTGKWCYVDRVYGENAEVVYDNKKYLIEIKYYANLPEDEKMILATYSVNIIFVPYDVWKREIYVGRDLV